VEQWPRVRIALVVTGGVDRSGREKVIPAILWLIERLARRHTVFVYALQYLEQPATYPLLGATIRDLGRPSGLFRQSRRLLDALKRDGPFDVVHGYWALPAGFAAAAAARRLGIPAVVTCDSGEFTAILDIEYGLQRRWRQRRAVAATLKLASQVTVCTTYMQRLARAHGADPTVIPIGVDTTIFTRRDRPPEGPPWRLLNVASLNPVKDHHTLIEAFRVVVERLGEVHLDIAGEDTMGGAIANRVRSLDLDRHVTFHGVLPSDALARRYRTAHLFVQSSRHEAAGVVALEAAASGVPVVGTAVGYVADWAMTRAAAVPPADPCALADAIVRLLTDPGERQRLAIAAHDFALTHDADWTASELTRLYETLAPASRT
jgi:glycosyltransferase involved in cell wall biosynthesis